MQLIWHLLWESAELSLLVLTGKLTSELGTDSTIRAMEGLMEMKGLCFKSVLGTCIGKGLRKMTYSAFGCRDFIHLRLRALEQFSGFQVNPR